VPAILSQQEIDSLLSGIPSEQPEASASPSGTGKGDKEAITFDFRLPHRLSKNQLRTFQAVHENFGETFSSYLVSRLQTTVAVNVASVDQLFYAEFVLSIANPSSLYVFRIMESDALGVLDMSPQLVLAMVEHLMAVWPKGQERTADHQDRTEHCEGYCAACSLGHPAGVDDGGRADLQAGTL